MGINSRLTSIERIRDMVARRRLDRKMMWCSRHWDNIIHGVRINLIEDLKIECDLLDAFLETERFSERAAVLGYNREKATAERQARITERILSEVRPLCCFLPKGVLQKIITTHTHEG